MLSNKIIKLPIPIPPKYCHEYDFDRCDITKYNEAIFDHRTNSWSTTHQTEENEDLKKEIEKLKKEKRIKLENIIGYFYKNNRKI